MLYGIVTKLDNQMTIDLPRGGKIKTKPVAGIRLGDTITFIIDATHNVTNVMLKKHTEKIIKCRENHLIEVSEREDYHDSDTTDIIGYGDESVFCYPDY